MAVWWESLMTIEKVLYCIAVPSTIIFVMQALFIIFGSHGHGMDTSDTSGIDFDHDVSGMHGIGLDHDVSGMHGIGLDHDISGMHGIGLDHDVSGMHGIGLDHDMSGMHGIGLDHDISGIHGAGCGHDISGVHGTDLNHGELDYSHISADDASTHHDAGDNLESFRLFTMQGIIGFFCMFSWASIAGIANDMQPGPAILIGFVLGFILMFVVAVIIKYSYRLAQDGTFDIRDTLGVNATVYLPIPPDKSGQGKVNVMVSERMVELNAITESDTVISTGETVRIIDIINDVVLVEKEV
ncbi:MAG: hypothetical protein SOV90_04530 [Lachnospiraceae bacterium]|nr:hypothetical protein [Lachnospiraceae bacterium]